MSHHRFIAGAADADQVDACGTRRPCVILLPLCGNDKDFGEHRIMTVQADIHRLGLKSTEVGGASCRLRDAKQDVGQIGCHGAAGEIGDSAAQAAEQQVHRIGVDPIQGAVHDLRDFMVDAFWYQLQVGEELCALRVDYRCCPEYRGVLFVEIGERSVGHVKGDLPFLSAFCRDIQTSGYSQKFVRRFDGVGLCSPQCHFFHGMGKVFGVAGMRRRPGGYRPIQSPSHHHIGAGAADPFFGPFAERIDAAWSLQTVPTAQAGIAEAALRCHGRVAIPDRCHVVFACSHDHPLYRRIETFMYGLCILRHNSLLFLEHANKSNCRQYGYSPERRKCYPGGRNNWIR